MREILCGAFISTSNYDPLLSHLRLLVVAFLPIVIERGSLSLEVYPLLSRWLVTFL